MTTVHQYRALKTKDDTCRCGEGEDMPCHRKPFRLGSVSTGTLRFEDLLPVLAETLDSFNTMPHKFVLEAKDLLESDIADFEEYAGYLINDITEALNALCPPFVHFGAHYGDGADFGFWPDMDRLNEELRWAGKSLGPGMEEVTIIEEGVIVHVNDHGNVTVMDRDRNVLWSVV